MKYKYIFFLLCFLGVNAPSLSEERVRAPVTISLFPFCSLDGHCKISLVLKNVSNYKVDMYSLTFENNRPNYQGIKALVIKEYLKMGANKEFTNINQKVKYSNKHKTNLTDFNRITLNPLEELAFNLDDMETVYNLDSEESYMIGFYLSFVHFYVDDQYVSTSSLGSTKYAYLRKPNKALKPRIIN